MKKIFQSILEHWLRSIARLLINKYQPRVIAVTGSFGKTTTKEAIYYALKPSLHSLRKNKASLNSELGVPLTIIGSKDPKGSIFRWLGVLMLGVKQLIIKNKFYPNTLVLEMGADKPGDIDYLLDIVTPQVSVLTGVGHTHLEEFGSVEKVAEEKLKLIKALPQDGVAVFNNDNSIIKRIITKPESRYLTYGLQDDSSVKASGISLELNDLDIESTTASNSDHIGGTSFRVTYQDQKYQTYLTNLLGHGYVYSALAALSVAIGLGLDIEKSVEGLREFLGSPGRMRLVSGIKGTFIIDDTYNASPEAMELALETLTRLQIQGKQWAVLGEMLELGSDSEKLHEKIGQRVAELDIDFLVISGKNAAAIAKGAIDHGYDKEKVKIFADKKTAGLYVQNEIKPGDLVLVKGSRGLSKETAGTRMERIVKEIMSNPQQAEELLYFTK